MAAQPTRSTRKGDEALQFHLVDEWLNSQGSSNTVAAYRSDMAMFGSWCAGRGSIALRADTTALVAYQLVRESAGDSPSTLRRRWSALSSFYDFALENQATATNPVRGLARPQVRPGNPSPTTLLSSDAVDEYRAIAAALDPRLDVLVGLLVADGLKLGEALALDVDHVRGKPPRITITIRRRGEAKRVTLQPDSARAVHRCIGSRREGPLLVSGRSVSDDGPRRLTRFGADHLIRQLSGAKNRRVTANELRRFHIVASHAGEDDPDEVRERAGLADVRSVRRYVD